MRCLGIDLGSSSIKAAVLNLDTEALEGTTSLPFPAARSDLSSKRFEVDLASIMTAVRDLSNRMLQLHTDVESIFLSSQMGGLILLDQKHQPISNYISWRDQRTLEQNSQGQSCFESAKEQLGPELLGELGNELKAGSTTTLLHWLQLHGRLPQASMPVTLGSYVASALTLQPPAVHRSEAIGVWNLKSGTWHESAFHRLGLDQLRWPRVAEDKIPVGQSSQLDRPVAVYPAVGDHPCSLLGVGLEVDELSINASTGSQVSRLTRELTLGNWQTRYALDCSYLHTITHLPAGRSLQALVSLACELGQVPETVAWNRIVQAVEQSNDSELAVDLSFFDGPMGNRGRIDGITLENLTIGNLFRAAFENMADNYHTCARRLWPKSDYQRIVLSGGLTQKFPYLRQAIRQRFACDMRECPEGDDALLGLLRLAASTFGIPRSTNSGASVR